MKISYFQGFLLGASVILLGIAYGWQKSHVDHYDAWDAVILLACSIPAGILMTIFILLFFFKKRKTALTGTFAEPFPTPPAVLEEFEKPFLENIPNMSFFQKKTDVLVAEGFGSSQLPI